ncbi:MAG: HEPN domain-containing protein [Nanoarchaeota archaeon]
MKERNNYISCFKKVNGLRLVDPNENLAKVYLRKSKSALHMLSSAIEKQENEWILDISYYAKYFVIYALFIKIGIKSEIHDCTIFALKKLFVNLGIIREEIYKELEKSRDLRVDALYYDKSFGEKEILGRAETAPDFCLEIEEIYEKISEQEMYRIRAEFMKMKSLI